MIWWGADAWGTDGGEKGGRGSFQHGDQQTSQERLKILSKVPGYDSPEQMASLGFYQLGKQRTLEQYMAFSGVDPRTRPDHDKVGSLWRYGLIWNLVYYSVWIRGLGPTSALFRCEYIYIHCLIVWFFLLFLDATTRSDRDKVSRWFLFVKRNGTWQPCLVQFCFELEDSARPRYGAWFLSENIWSDLWNIVYYSVWTVKVRCFVLILWFCSDTE